MIGFRTFLVSAAAAAAFIPAAEAQNRYASQADCEANRQGRQVAGAIVGAIIGGVIGAEIEDEIDDRDNYRGRHYGYRGYHGRGYHRGRHHHYNQRHENDVAVVAGAGIGALVGAGVAGGQPCQPDYRYRDSGYYGDDYGYRDPYYNDHHSRTDYGYDSYDYQPDQNRIYYGNEGLAGAPVGESRIYQASAPQTDNCRWMTTRSQNQYGTVSANDVYMCQGIDGIWRPAQ
ncbi:hypothetical protein [Hyphobacterium sp.]|uniref:hypothetical protein n=1 Tax=Hyphobacterium sp. TaxID=2004662 RepID=UPI003BAA70E6